MEQQKKPESEKAESKQCTAAEAINLQDAKAFLSSIIGKTSAQPEIRNEDESVLVKTAIQQASCDKYCIVPECLNRDGLDNDRGVRFFRFPRHDKEQFQLWIVTLRQCLEDDFWKPKPETVICSAHFAGHFPSGDRDDVDYVPTEFPGKMLKPAKLKAVNVTKAKLVGLKWEEKRRCVVKTCGRNNRDHLGCFFFDYPKDKALFEKWVRVLEHSGMTGSNAGSQDVPAVCQDHFEDEMFQDPSTRKFLVRGAVPMLKEVLSVTI